MDKLVYILLITNLIFVIGKLNNINLIFWYIFDILILYGLYKYNIINFERRNNNFVVFERTP